MVAPLGEKHMTQQNSETRIDIPALLARLPLFQELTPEQVAHIAAQTREKRLARGEMLFQKGDPPRGFYVVVFGQLKLAFPSSSGNEKVVDILGPKPTRKKSYFEDSGVLGRISTQYSAIRKAKGLPLWASERYRWDRKATQAGSMCCSLVRSVKGFPGICFGHVIEVPHFGKIFLGELKVERKKPERSGDPETYTFHLTMIRLELGCVAHGSGNIVPLDSNGGGKP